MKDTLLHGFPGLYWLFDNGTHPASFAPGSLAIENLYIQNCPNTGDYMIHLLKACHRLTSFKYEQFYDSEGVHEGTADYELYVLKWHTALSLHKDSLEELSLDNMKGYRIHREWEVYPLHAWPSFTAFLTLKTLKIEHRRMAYAGLPPNLKYLYLFDCRRIDGREEIDRWCAIQTYCPFILQFEIMTTQDCRISQYIYKHYGFGWSYWTEQARIYHKIDFLLKVWFKDFIDGTHHFSQGTDDTKEKDSNGYTIENSNEDDENGEDENGENDFEQAENEDGQKERGIQPGPLQDLEEEFDGDNNIER
ncbi:hypothetical protein K458DRAFT_92430 [Lentithecium fluviatile CBS 122367]|uniref:Uncharacterized protein n=1 Tax=Lentithecium fluviatile CBS 122367 TaxID=1168545 RepID=A0A6G1IQK3_9PLEO|nr:hypothetical protein K458DRAFT_92430 [Lentithecium fluviatile CBS 122367]